MSAVRRKLVVGTSFDWKAISAQIIAGGHDESLRKWFANLVTLHIETGAVDLTTYLNPDECRAMAAALNECADVAEALGALLPEEAPEAAPEAPEAAA
jgi:hypothetical protein